MQVLDAFVAPASRGGERRSTENANSTWLSLNEAVTLKCTRIHGNGRRTPSIWNRRARCYAS